MIDQEELCRRAVLTQDPDDYDAAAYALGFHDPEFPMPAIRTFFDVWGPEDTVSGKYELTGMEEYKRGYWRCFVNTDDNWRE